MTIADQRLDAICPDERRLEVVLDALYDYGGNVCTKVHHRSRIALFARLLRRLLDDGTIRVFDRALDLGCNAGFYSKLISDFGCKDVVGVDIDAGYVATANAAFGSEDPAKRVRFYTADATRLEFDGTFDFILCTEVIEHTDDPHGVVRRIASLLSPRGVAVVSLPNALSLGFATAYAGAKLRRRMSKDLSDHLKYPFYKGPALFSRHGLRVTRTTGANCLLNDRLIEILFSTPLFGPITRLNAAASERWPFKWAAQFFFFVVARDLGNNRN